MASLPVTSMGFKITPIPIKIAPQLTLQQVAGSLARTLPVAMRSHSA
jgi:hypothetical protein